MSDEAFLPGVPWLGRVLAALLLAGEVGDAIPAGEMSSAATTALDNAWQWVAQRSVSAESLNEHGDRFSEYSSRQLNEQCSAAVCAVGLAMYYVAWHAYREELETGTTVDADVPENIAEISDEALLEIRDFVREALAGSEQRIDVVLEKIQALQLTGEATRSTRIR